MLVGGVGRMVRLSLSWRLSVISELACSIVREGLID